MAGTFEPYQQLEKEFAEWLGVEYAVAVSSGTAGLHLALAALGIRPGKRVRIDGLTHISNQFVVQYLGAEVSDKDYDARIITHLYGRPKVVQESALLIEDCSEAHGATIDGYKVGTLGDISVFSLYKNKIIHAEEGGIVCTNNFALYQELKALKNFDNDDFSTIHTRLSYNYRMPNAMASMALASLHEVEENLKKREQVAYWYRKNLPDHKQLPTMPGMVWWVYDIVLDTYEEREKIVTAIPEARRFFYPCEEGFYLPIYPEFSEDKVKNLCTQVRNVLQ